MFKVMQTLPFVFEKLCLRPPFAATLLIGVVENEGAAITEDRDSLCVGGKGGRCEGRWSELLHSSNKPRDGLVGSRKG